MPIDGGKPPSAARSHPRLCRGGEEEDDDDEGEEEEEKTRVWKVSNQ